MTQVKMTKSDESALADLFSENTRPARASRYTVANTRETREGGRVGVGVDAKGAAFLVHEIGRATEAMSLGAVATAVAAGAIPPVGIARACKAAGTLEALAAACAEALK
jgi:hypothetical protein